MLIDYYTRGDPGARYYARINNHPTLPKHTEWRLDATGWTELFGAPILGWMLKGEVDLDQISSSEVPTPITAETLNRK